MPSTVVTDARRQVALEFDESLARRFRCLRDVVAQGVYLRGLKAVAADLDLSPGNLSVALSDDPHRKLGVDELERYIQTTGDRTPIYWLIARYLGDDAAARDHALEQVAGLLANLPQLLHAAGLQGGATKGRK